jgi:hypothetical protein
MTLRDRMAALYRERRREGLCTDCGRPELNRARCRVCRVKRAERQARYRQKKAA